MQHSPTKRIDNIRETPMMYNCVQLLINLHCYYQYNICIDASNCQYMLRVLRESNQHNTSQSRVDRNAAEVVLIYNIYIKYDGIQFYLTLRIVVDILSKIPHYAVASSYSYSIFSTWHLLIMCCSLWLLRVSIIYGKPFETTISTKHLG